MTKDANDILARLTSLEQRVSRLANLPDLTNRWLTAVAIFLTLFAFAGIFVGLWGFDKMERDIARGRVLLTESESIVRDMRAHQMQSKRIASEVRTSTADGAENKDCPGSMGFPIELFGANRNGCPEQGRLASGAGKSFSIDAEETQTYTVIGMCDERCNDLDLAVYENETLVAEDISEAKVPFVTFETKESKQYRVRVHMWDCEPATTEGNDEESPRACDWQAQLYVGAISAGRSR